MIAGLGAVALVARDVPPRRSQPDRRDSLAPRATQPGSIRRARHRCGQIDGNGSCCATRRTAHRRAPVAPSAGNRLAGHPRPAGAATLHPGLRKHAGPWRAPIRRNREGRHRPGVGTVPDTDRAVGPAATGCIRQRRLFAAFRRPGRRSGTRPGDSPGATGALRPGNPARLASQHPGQRSHRAIRQQSRARRAPITDMPARAAHIPPLATHRAMSFQG